MLPDDADLTSPITVTAVIIPEATGNVYVINSVGYGTCGEAIDTHVDVHDIGGAKAIGVTVDVYNCIASVTLTVATLGDIMNVLFSRVASDVLDTVGDACGFAGWIVSYTRHVNQ
jgi:hypothetical protein